MDTEKMEVFLALSIMANHIEETFKGEKRCIHCLAKMKTNGSVNHKKACPIHVSQRVLKKLKPDAVYRVDGGFR